MIFEPTSIDGAVLVRIEPFDDDRGFFARTWCHEEFAARGIDMEIVQASISHTRLAGTVRGMHYSALPAREGKLVRCERGRIHDVIVDIRPESPSFLRQFALELDDRSHLALFIPPFVAHGYQSLEADCRVLYMMSDSYRPELARGLRYDDPLLDIRWPLPVSAIAERDRSWPDLVRAGSQEPGA